MEIEASTDIFKLDDGQRDLYATLGRFQYFMASYEFDCDEFVFAVAESKREFVATNRMKSPYGNHPETIEFIDQCIHRMAELSDLRELTLGSEGLPLKEYMSWIWKHRNNLSHGKLFMARSQTELKEFKFTRWVREEKKGPFSRVQYSYDSSLLKSIVNGAQRVRVLLHSAAKAVRDES